MSESMKNKIAAQIIKAEMLGDHSKVERLKDELKSITSLSPTYQEKPSPSVSVGIKRDWRKSTDDNQSKCSKHKCDNPRVKRFLDSSCSIKQIFDQEKTLTAADEAKMFIKTSAKFSRDDMETKYFSSEMDNSQEILNKSKRSKIDSLITIPKSNNLPENSKPCSRCPDRIARHFVINKDQNVFLAVPNFKPFLPGSTNIYISNLNHNETSFVSSSPRTQYECEKYIDTLRDLWRSTRDRCIIMETYIRDRHPNRNDLISCGHHFQVHCIPIKEKYFERVRMGFKQALQDCEKEWSLNKKLITTEGRKIQRCLPKGLSYFWVCFDELDNGFSHVIENEREFSRFFGLEVLSGIIDKNFDPMNLHEREDSNESFTRCRDFKLLLANYTETLDKNESATISSCNAGISDYGKLKPDR